MANLTDNNTVNSSYNFRWGVWTCDIVGSSILLLVSLYIFVALLYHQIKVQKPKSNRFFQLPPAEQYFVASRYICVFIGFFTIVRNVTSVISGVLVEEIGIGSDIYSKEVGISDVFCNFLRKICNFALTFGSALVYSFLWCRQRIFYVHPSLKVIESTVLHHFSNDAIKVWLVPYVFLHVVYFATISYRYYKPGICQFEMNSGEDVDYGKIIFTWVVISAMMQICLLGLFLTPIYRRSEWLYDQQNRQSSSLMKKIKKAALIASICVFTELFAGLILIMSFEENANTLTTPHSFNLVINHLATIAYFDNWRDMLWPWHKKYAPIVSVPNDDDDGSFFESSPLIYDYRNNTEPKYIE